MGDGDAAVDCASSLALLRNGKGVRLVLQQPGLQSHPESILDGSSLLDSARRRALHTALQPHYTCPGPGVLGRALIAPTKRRFWTLLKSKAKAAVSLDKIRGRSASQGPSSSASLSDASTRPSLRIWAPSFRDPRVMPFLDPSLRQTLLRQPGQEDGDEDGDLLLYRGVMHPEVTGLGFVGYEAHSSTSPLVLELQAQWLVALLTSRLALPPPAAMRADLEAQRAWRSAALTSPLMSARGSLAVAHERSYVQQLVNDLRGIVELHTSTGGAVLCGTRNQPIQDESATEPWAPGNRDVSGAPAQQASCPDGGPGDVPPSTAAQPPSGASCKPLRQAPPRRHTFAVSAALSTEAAGSGSNRGVDRYSCGSLPQGPQGRGPQDGGVSPPSKAGTPPQAVIAGSAAGSTAGCSGRGMLASDGLTLPGCEVDRHETASASTNTLASARSTPACPVDTINTNMSVVSAAACGMDTGGHSKYGQAWPMAPERGSRQQLKQHVWLPPPSSSTSESQSAVSTLRYEPPWALLPAGRAAGSGSSPLAKLLPNTLERWMLGKANSDAGSAKAAAATKGSPIRQSPAAASSGGGFRGRLGLPDRQAPRRSLSYNAVSPAAGTGTYSKGTCGGGSSVPAAVSRTSAPQIPLQHSLPLRQASPLGPGLGLGPRSPLGSCPASPGTTAENAGESAHWQPKIASQLGPSHDVPVLQAGGCAAEALEAQLSALRTHLNHPDQVPFPAVPPAAAAASAATPAAASSKRASPVASSCSTPVQRRTQPQASVPSTPAQSGSLFGPEEQLSVSLQACPPRSVPLGSSSAPNLPDIDALRMLTTIQERPLATESADSLERVVMEAAQLELQEQQQSSATLQLPQGSHLSGQQVCLAASFGVSNSAGYLVQPDSPAHSASGVFAGAYDGSGAGASRGGGGTVAAAAAAVAAAAAQRRRAPPRRSQTASCLVGGGAGLVPLTTGLSGGLQLQAGSPDPDQALLPQSAATFLPERPRLSGAGDLRGRATALLTRFVAPWNLVSPITVTGRSPAASLGRISAAAKADVFGGGAATEYSSEGVLDPALLLQVPSQSPRYLASPAGPSGLGDQASDSSVATGMSGKLFSVLPQRRTSGSGIQHYRTLSGVSPASPGAGVKGTALPRNIPSAGRAFRRSSGGGSVAGSMGKSLGGLLDDAAEAALLPYRERIQETVVPEGVSMYAPPGGAARLGLDIPAHLRAQAQAGTPRDLTPNAGLARGFSRASLTQQPGGGAGPAAHLFNQPAGASAPLYNLNPSPLGTRQPAGGWPEGVLMQPEPMSDADALQLKTDVQTDEESMIDKDLMLTINNVVRGSGEPAAPFVGVAPLASTAAAARQPQAGYQLGKASGSFGANHLAGAPYDAPFAASPRGPRAVGLAPTFSTPLELAAGEGYNDEDRPSPALAVRHASQARQDQLVDQISSRLRGAIARRASRLLQDGDAAAPGDALRTPFAGAGPADGGPASGPLRRPPPRCQTSMCLVNLARPGGAAAAAVATPASALGSPDVRAKAAGVYPLTAKAAMLGGAPAGSPSQQQAAEVAAAAAGG